MKISNNSVLYLKLMRVTINYIFFILLGDGPFTGD